VDDISKLRFTGKSLSVAGRAGNHAGDSNRVNGEAKRLSQFIALESSTAFLRPDTLDRLELWQFDRYGEESEMKIVRYDQSAGRDK
jgi:hypothetical protein